MSYKGFNSVELRRPKRSTFDLSHEKRVSSRIGKLTPVFITETIPNDTFYGSTEVLVKLAPMIAPIYHRLNLYVHYFFVPNRLLWKDWETFITGGRLGNEVTTPPVPPKFHMQTVLSLGENLFQLGSISDYLGIPLINDSQSAAYNNRFVDAMPFGAIYKCYMDYYRDRNYVPDTTHLPMNSGENAAFPLLRIRYRCWQHDYFTSSLPFTQRGQEVLMPLQGSGQVTYTPLSEWKYGDGTDAGTGAIYSNSGGAQLGNPGPGVRIENIDEITIENSEVSINDLRRAVALQSWLERNALGGSRYPETIMAHFGRKSSDARLQRAEYLGGGKAVIKVDEVMTTAYSEDGSSETVPPANPSGKASAYANTNKFSYNCEEHGFIVGILSVMPTSSYMQGMPRMFQQRNTFLEYPWPSFAHLGEQEVYEYELYADASTLQPNRADNPLFGYQSRYADWKFIQSSTHGDFRTSLDIWHLTRKFSDNPVLGEKFVTFEDELQDRIFNVSEVDTLWMYVYNKVHVKRSLPYFGTPML